MSPGRLAVTIYACGALGLAACGGDGDGDDAPVDPDAAVTVDAVPPADASPCPRVLAPADRPRKVVVSLPYDAKGAQATRYRVLDLAENGVLSTSATYFSMGRAFSGKIAFTPDGEVGLVAQQDGTLGVFRLVDGVPEVVHAAFAGSFYADKVVVDPGGSIAYVLDNQWRNNGGGVYRVAIGCDGTLTDLGLWFEAKLASGLHLRGGRAVLAAIDVGSSPAGDDVHLLDWTAGPPAAPAVLDGADAFGDDEQIVGGSAVTADGAFALIGDYQGITSAPNRVAVVALDGDAVTPTQVLAPVIDPLDILASPYGDAALVVTGLDDAVVILDYDPRAASPFAVRGEPAYTGGAPQLPGNAAMIERGNLRGLVLLSELHGVRRIRFGSGAQVTDLGRTSTGSGFDSIVGAVGVQP